MIKKTMYLLGIKIYKMYLKRIQSNIDITQILNVIKSRKTKKKYILIRYRYIIKKYITIENN